MRVGLRCTAYMILLTLLTAPCWADSYAVVVNLDNKTVQPANPAVNNWSQDTIVIEVEGKGSSQTEIGLTIPGLVYSRDGQRVAQKKTLLSGPRSPITFLRCGQRTELDERAFPDRERLTCPFAIRDEEPDALTVYTRARTFAVRILTTDAEQEVETVSIQVYQKPFELGWSAGVAMFPSAEDHRYRLTPTPDEPDMAVLERVGAANLPYQFSAFAHYVSHEYNKFGVSFGLSTDIPVEDLSIMLGGTLALRTLPLVNTGYITAGIAYTKSKRLRSEYEGLERVSASLTTDALTDDEYDFELFVALTFGFLGGEDQFKGVFPGSENSD